VHFDVRRAHELFGEAHRDVIVERLARADVDVELVVRAPSVQGDVTLRDDDKAGQAVVVFVGAFPNVVQVDRGNGRHVDERGEIVEERAEQVRVFKALLVAAIEFEHQMVEHVRYHLLYIQRIDRTDGTGRGKRMARRIGRAQLAGVALTLQSSARDSKASRWNNRSYSLSYLTMGVARYSRGIMRPHVHVASWRDAPCRRAALYPSAPRRV